LCQLKIIIRTYFYCPFAGYLRSIFSAFGDVESVSVCEFKPNADNDEAVGGTKANDIAENVPSSFESRFAHLVFAKKISMKSALAASDSAYFELTKAIAKVGLI
jgi:hypothetical protein